MIKVSLKGLAKFMMANSSQQRKILRDYKFPDPEGHAQATYYREATKFIKAFHEKSHPKNWLQLKIEELEKLVAVSSGQTRVRLEHNVSALEAYKKYFSDRAFDVQSNLKLKYTHGNVLINILPDLCVEEKGVFKLIKLEYSKNIPDTRIIKIITQTIFDSASPSFPKLKTSDVLLFDVARGDIYKGARLGSRVKKEIEDACANIEALWPTIK